MHENEMSRIMENLLRDEGTSRFNSRSKPGVEQFISLRKWPKPIASV
jgi:hypothetical protein